MPTLKHTSQSHEQVSPKSNVSFTLFMQMVWHRIAKHRQGRAQVAVLRGLRISTFIFAIALVYFVFHFFVGQQGLLSWRGYIARADALTVERDQLVARRAALETRIGRMQPGQVDADFVEERAFSQLGLLGPKDIAIPLPQPELPKEGGATVVTPSTQTPNL
jgi:cell division protein FtsB